MAWFIANTPTEAHTHFRFLLECHDRAVQRLSNPLGMRAETTNERRHHNCSRDYTFKFADYISEAQLERIARSPLIAVAFDESTDLSVSSDMVVYIYFIEDGEVKVEFFTILKLSGAAAPDIVAALVKALEGEPDTDLRRAGLVRKPVSSLIVALRSSKVSSYGRSATICDTPGKVIVVGSDGCSVMLGKNKGVGALLRKRPEPNFKWMLQFHCAAHKLQLATGDAFSGEDCVEIDRMISCIHRLFKQSSQSRAELERIYDAFTAAQKPEAKLRMLMIKRHVVTRWLSRHSTISSIVDRGAFEAVFRFVQVKDDAENGEKDEYDEPGLTAAGRKKAMGLEELAASLLDFERVAMLHFLGDITGPLNQLSKPPY